MKAEVVDEFPVGGRSRSPNGTSKWDRYLDGQIWSIEFRPRSLEGTRVAIHAAARRLGGKVRTQSEGDRIFVQFFQPDASDAEAIQ